MSEETQEPTQASAEEINDLHEKVRDQIITCEALNPMYCGQVTAIDDNSASSYMSIINEHLCDEKGLAHAGFIYSAAVYLAQVALKKPNTFALQSRVHYLAPVRVGDVLMFEATARLEKTKRPEVNVRAHVRDICVFDGVFYVLCTDEHVLKLQESELRKYQTRLTEISKQIK